MSRRRTQGSETWNRLRDWDRGSAASERLAGHLLRAEGYHSIDPIHPLGGPDGLKDILSTKDGLVWRTACFFPRGEKALLVTQRKFAKDLGTLASDQGFVFVTNQELRLADRKKLVSMVRGGRCDLFHLERIASILDSPAAYGVRLEFLDIEMNKAEQISFFASHQTVLSELANKQDLILQGLEIIRGDPAKVAILRDSVPLDDLKEFTKLLDSIASPLALARTFSFKATVSDLRVPIADLREFEKILNSIASPLTSLMASSYKASMSDLRVPLAELKEFEKILSRIDVRFSGFQANQLLSVAVGNMRVPLAELREYEETLDRIYEKKRRLG